MPTGNLIASVPVEAFTSEEELGFDLTGAEYSEYSLCILNVATGKIDDILYGIPRPSTQEEFVVTTSYVAQLGIPPGFLRNS